MTYMLRFGCVMTIIPCVSLQKELKGLRLRFYFCRKLCDPETARYITTKEFETVLRKKRKKKNFENAIYLKIL